MGLPIRADRMGSQRMENEVKMQIERWKTTVQQLVLVLFFIQDLECGINSISYRELAPYQLLFFVFFFEIKGWALAISLVLK